MTAFLPRHPATSPRTGLSRPEPAGTGPAGPARPPRPSGPAGPAGRSPRHHASAPTPAPADAAPTSLCARLERMAWTFVQLFLEVEAGRRPRGQLRPVMCPVLYARVSQVWIRTGPPGRLLRVRGDLTGDDCYEAVAVVRRGERVGAVSLRLVHTPSGWRAEDLARPEDGPLPHPPHAFPVDEPDTFDLVAERPTLEGHVTGGYS